MTGFICVLDDGEYHEYSDPVEMKANADLIAAAPDMYDWQSATLDVLRQICKSIETPDNIRIQLEPLIYRGEEIQKKARGEE